MNKVINRLLNDAVEDADIYSHNGSVWLIFTERKQWVIELEKSGNLWYNYGFFKNLFNYVSLDVVINQDYIAEWVEDVIQNGVKDTNYLQSQFNWEIENVIQNGITNIEVSVATKCRPVEDVIQNGVII